MAAGKHALWNTAGKVVDIRRAEDRLACARVGAAVRHWTLPDCIYRGLPDGAFTVNGESDLWLPLHPAEMPLVEKLRRHLARVLPKDARLAVPLTLGNHVDHRLVRSAAEALRRPLYYYADFPYAARPEGTVPPGVEEDGLERTPVSAVGLQAWQEAIDAYRSQVDDLFGSSAGMRAQVAAYWQRGGGQFLWKGGFTARVA